MIDNHWLVSIKASVSVLQKLDARFNQKLFNKFFKNMMPWQSLLFSHTFRKIVKVFSFLRFETLHPCDQFHLIIVRAIT